MYCIAFFPARHPASPSRLARCVEYSLFGGRWYRSIGGFQPSQTIRKRPLAWAKSTAQRHHYRRALIGVFTGHHNSRSLQQDFEIEPQRAVLDIVKIVRRRCVGFFEFIDAATQPVHLSPAGDAQLEAVTMKILLDCIAIKAMPTSSVPKERCRPFPSI
jgi:hypothetical protein